MTNQPQPLDAVTAAQAANPATSGVSAGFGLTLAGKDGQAAETAALPADTHQPTAARRSSHLDGYPYADHVRAVVAAAPPLSPAQRDALALLIRPYLPRPAAAARPRGRRQRGRCRQTAEPAAGG
jgi:hypothetical protein